MAIAWWGLQRRALRHLDVHHHLMKLIEDELKIDPILSSSMLYNKQMNREYLKIRPTAHLVMRLCCYFVIVLWVTLLLLPHLGYQLWS